MTTQFYAPPSSIRGQRLILDGDEAKHIAKSLRMEPGQRIQVVDGQGKRYTVELGHVRPKQVVGTIRKTVDGAGEPPYRLCLGLGLLKNRSRFETFLEKAVECGVHRIVPLLTERTEVQSLREKRSRNILIAAMKQSGRSVLPNLATPTVMSEMLAGLSRDDRPVGGGWIAHEAASAPPLPKAVQSFRRDNMQEGALAESKDGEPLSRRPDLTVLVGPEGGFSDREVQTARDAGFQPVRLGPHRLRAETAGIVAASAVSMAFAAGERPQDAAFL